MDKKPLYYHGEPSDIQYVIDDVLSDLNNLEERVENLEDRLNRLIYVLYQSRMALTIIGEDYDSLRPTITEEEDE